MRVVRRVAVVVVPVALVVGAVAYGVAHHGSSHDSTLGECTTKVGRLTVVIDAAQARNASLIAAISTERGLPAHAATIALATALQESKLYNLPGGDRDSLGLFQQRPSQGWGTKAQIMDPVHATNSFYTALARVPGYDTLPVTVAAQRVQHSDYPSAYAVYENDARALASALTGYSPAAFACHVKPAARSTVPAARRAAELRRALAPGLGATPVTVAAGSHLAIPAPDPPRGWEVASYLVAHATRLGLSSVSYAGRTWTAGSAHGWTRGGGASSAAVLVD